MVIIWGTRVYGKVDSFGGTWVGTQFAHLWFVPLFPKQSVVFFGAGGALPTTLHARSVLAGFLRGPACIAGVIAVLVASADARPGAAFLLPACAAAVVLPVLLSHRIGKLPAAERAARFVYWEVLGDPIDPALVHVEEQLRDRLALALEKRARSLGRAYRDAPSASRGAMAFAEEGGGEDAAFLKGAITLCRMQRGAAASLEEKRTLDRRHATLWSHLVRLDPSVQARATRGSLEAPARSPLLTDVPEEEEAPPVAPPLDVVAREEAAPGVARPVLQGCLVGAVPYTPVRISDEQRAKESRVARIAGAAMALGGSLGARFADDVTMEACFASMAATGLLLAVVGRPRGDRGQEPTWFLAGIMATFAVAGLVVLRHYL